MIFAAPTLTVISIAIPNIFNPMITFLRIIINIYIEMANKHVHC